ncbi:hypothetical protein QF046_002574 [Microbacterium sp. W4I4]|uniref:DUF4380 domain-containing protein n=1 Tax=Microbacterium sp. W4I4 TaxID=3042295 RepID=UPI0027851017|nr:DUF4380 domain-containing protein [Microbacterium sp. W4I4]MDQ0614933.1 hypothetical protein [Microbacterium sp. W4I4]
MSRIELRAEGVQAVVVPELGGRMLSLRFDGREVLWHDPELLDDDLQPRHPITRPALGAGYSDWQNWGGDKTWPAPQGPPGSADGWPGPPDGVLDSGAYRVVEVDRDAVLLRSDIEPRTGLRIERELRVKPGAVLVRSTVINDSGPAARWAAWEVAQFPFDADDLASDRARIDVRMHGDAPPTVLFDSVGSIDWSRKDDTARARFSEAVGKLGFPGATGAAELVRADGWGVRMSFTVTPDAEYADDSPVQLWMQTPVDRPLPGLEGMTAHARYVELEALSPTRLLEPGDRISLEVRWESIDRAT